MKKATEGRRRKKATTPTKQSKKKKASSGWAHFFPHNLRKKEIGEGEQKMPKTRKFHDVREKRSYKTYPGRKKNRNGKCLKAKKQNREKREDFRMSQTATTESRAETGL